MPLMPIQALEETEGCVWDLEIYERIPSVLGPSPILGKAHKGYKVHEPHQLHLTQQVRDLEMARDIPHGNCCEHLLRQFYAFQGKLQATDLPTLPYRITTIKLLKCMRTLWLPIAAIGRLHGSYFALCAKMAA